MSKDKHQHEFKEIQLIRITKVQSNYKGVAGDKALLVRACDCKASTPIEYGNYDDMVKLGKQLKKIGREHESSSDTTGLNP